MEANEDEGWEQGRVRMERQRNTLPKARQRQGAPGPEVWKERSLSRGGHGRGSNLAEGESGSRKGSYSNLAPGEGAYRGRGGREGRGRGRGRGGRGGYDGSLEKVTRAPSQRRINSMSIKRKAAAEKTMSASYNLDALPPRVPRSASMPREQDTFKSEGSQSSLANSTPWAPGGRCPSFADMLKKSMTSLEALDQEEIHLPSTSEGIQRQRNTLPKVRQREGAPSQDVTMEKNTLKHEEVTVRVETPAEVQRLNSAQFDTVPKGFGADVPVPVIAKQTEVNKEKSVNSLSLFSHHIVTQVQTPQTGTADPAAFSPKERRSATHSSEEGKNNKKPETQAAADDDISSIRFHHIKSYANILSSGARKVREVFKEAKKTPVKEVEFIHPALQHKEREPTQKPEIPGLIFRTDFERSKSPRKKSKSRTRDTPDKENSPRPVQCMEITAPEKSQEEEEEETLLDESIHSNEEVMDSTKAQVSSIKRKNSKKKKEATQVPKFIDEIDQALHEIQIMEKDIENKSKYVSLPRIESKRPSKKSKTLPPTEDYFSKVKKEIEVDGEHRVPMNLAASIGDLKTTTDIVWSSEEIQCLVEEEPNKRVEVKKTKKSSSDFKEFSNELGIKPYGTSPNQKSALEPVEIKESALKQAGIALPISEMTFDWMDDNDTIGTIDSDDEDIDEKVGEEIKHLQSCSKNTKFSAEINNASVTETVVGVKNAEKDSKTCDGTPELKLAGIALPTTEMSFDWMDDDVVPGTMDSDDEQEANEEILEDIIKPTATHQDQNSEVIQEIHSEKIKPEAFDIQNEDLTHVLTTKCDSSKSTDSDAKLNIGISSDCFVEEELQQEIKTMEIHKEVQYEIIKPAGISLHTTKMSCDWMDEGDNIGSMDSEDDMNILEKHDKPKETNQETKHDQAKPAGIALPITAMSYNWMDDGEAIGSLDSEDEEATIRNLVCSSKIEEYEQGNISKVKDSPKEALKPEADNNETKLQEVKTAGNTLPMTDMSYNWMEVGEAKVSTEFDSDEDNLDLREDLQEHKYTQVLKNPVKLIQEKLTLGETKQKTIEDTVKPQGLNLPTQEMTFDWMVDGDAVGSMDSEDDETTIDAGDKSNPSETTQTEPVQADSRPDGIALPTTEMTEDWMNDDVAIGSLDSDEDETVEKEVHPSSHLPLALQAPSYAMIASHEALHTIDDVVLPPAPDVVVLKPVATIPLVVNVEENPRMEKEKTIDDEGFEEVVSRQIKKDQSINRRTSQQKNDVAEKKEVQHSDEAPGGLIDSVQEEGKQNKEGLKQDIKEPETKPVGIALPITEMTDTWMDDDIIILSDDDESEKDDIKKVSKQINEMECKISRSEQSRTGTFSLPIAGVTDAWMDDDIVIVPSEEEDICPWSKKSTLFISCYSPCCNGNGCYSPLCKANHSKAEKEEEEYDDNDRETQMFTEIKSQSPKLVVKEGRGSALAQAQRFSCDEEDDTFEADIVGVVKDIKLDDDDESTSWAFVAAKESQKEKEVLTEKISELIEHSPALVVEIIEQGKKVETVDKEGYKVVSIKNKVMKTRADTKKSFNNEDIIKKLDQPLEGQLSSLSLIETKPAGIALPISEMTDDWMNNDDTIGSIESDIEEPLLIDKNISNRITAATSTNLNSESKQLPESEDPWLAVKPEYKRKDSSASDKDGETECGYTIQVKVTTKETCLGRRLHENQSEQDWKMDVTCIQSGQIPNIVEGHAGKSEASLSQVRGKKLIRPDPGLKDAIDDRKYHSLPRPKTQSESSQGALPPLSPSWMRKDLSRSESIESNLSRYQAESRTSMVSSSCESLDMHEGDDIYWRLKQKVKKKKRRNISGPEASDSIHPTPLTVPVLITEPIIEESTSRRSSTVTALHIVTSSVSKVESVTETADEMTPLIVETQPHAATSFQESSRKTSVSQKDVTCERTLSVEFDDIRKQSVSPMLIDHISSISVPLEEVAETDVCDEVSKKKISITPSITLDDYLTADSISSVNIQMGTPEIVLSNSKMEEATQLLRACSPREPGEEEEAPAGRPIFMRQNSKEMQSAVDVPRGGPSPVSFEKQKHLSVSNPPDTWQDEEDISYGDTEDDQGSSKWSAIAAKVCARKKSDSSKGKRSRKNSKNINVETEAPNQPSLEVDVKEPKFEIEENQPQEKKSTFASLPTDTLTDAWMNDDVGGMSSEDEEVEKEMELLNWRTMEPCPLALAPPSYAMIASHESLHIFEDPPLPSLSPSEMVPLKHTSSLPLVINVEEKSDIEDDTKDADGFVSVTTRKVKRERRTSRRVSNNEEVVENEDKDRAEPEKDKITIEQIKPAGFVLDIPEVIDSNISGVDNFDCVRDGEGSTTVTPLLSYAAIASHEKQSTSTDHEDLTLHIFNRVSSKTVVINVEEKFKEEGDTDKDQEGFVEVVTRKDKRERRTSKRISQTEHIIDSSVINEKSINKILLTETHGNCKTEMLRNLSMESFWMDKYIFEDAEAKFYAQKKTDNMDHKDSKENNDKKDDDDDCSDKKDDNEEGKRDKDRQKTPSNEEDQLEVFDYNWSDDSTYLSPQIPVLSPTPIKIGIPFSSNAQVKNLTKQIKVLSSTIEMNNDSLEDHLNNNQIDVAYLPNSTGEVQHNKSQLQVQYEDETKRV